MNLGATEIAIILIVILVIFGPRQLPSIGKSLGQAIKEFRGAGKELMKGTDEE